MLEVIDKTQHRAKTKEAGHDKSIAHLLVWTSIKIPLISPLLKGRKGQVRHYGKIDGTLSALDKVVRKLVSKGNRLHFVYEAGPCGYQIYRHLTAQGFDCDVVAPSRIPKPSGNRSKMTAGMP
jgi:hypothetical protein